MADSAVLTSTTMAKRNQTPNEDVWESVFTLFTDNGAHVEGTVATPLNGVIRSIVVVLPASTSTGTTSTVTIDDNSNAEVFNSGALAEGDTYVFAVDLPLSGIVDISLDMDGDPGASGVSNIVTLRGI
jgi:hypothetical protein